MSSLYKITVSISKLTEKEIKILKKEYGSDLFAFKDSVNLEYIQSLTEDYWFCQNICECVWNKLKRYVPITAISTYLENAPFEEYKFTKKDYNSFKKEPL